MAARCKGIAGEGSAAAAAPPHVLAVDDSSVDRAVIASILRSSKFRVTAVDSGKRAPELLGSVRVLLHRSFNFSASFWCFSCVRYIKRVLIICVHCCRSPM